MPHCQLPSFSLLIKLKVFCGIDYCKAYLLTKLLEFRCGEALRAQVTIRYFVYKQQKEALPTEKVYV